MSALENFLAEKIGERRFYGETNLEDEEIILFDKLASDEIRKVYRIDYKTIFGRWHYFKVGRQEDCYYKVYLSIFCQEPYEPSEMKVDCLSFFMDCEDYCV